MTLEHPDEGTIHAWLDGALDDTTSARIAEHVAGCAACTAATAEARGLIAGAARVVRALDPPRTVPVDLPRDLPLGVAQPADGGSAWRMLRVTPARAAIAATLLVVVGLTLTRDWAAHEEFTPATAVRPASQSIAASAARDPLLDSAIRRNVTEALPPRAVQRAPGVDVPQAEGAARANAVDETAPSRVAAGRAMARAAREAAPPATADAAAVGALARASAPVAMKAAAVGSPQGARECLRVESAAPNARWTGVPLPWQVTLGAGGVARVQPESGGATLDGTWRRAGESTRLVLPDGQSLSIVGATAERRGALTSPTAEVAVMARMTTCLAHE